MNVADSPGPVWLLTDQLPAPPRNGITLPVFHYANALHEAGRLRLCLLDASPEGAPAEALQANAALFGPIDVLRFVRRPAGRRLRDELAGRDMFQHGWDAVDPPAPLLQALASATAWLVSPVSAVAKARALSEAWPATGPRRVAAVNDCTAAEFHYRSRAPGLSLAQAAKARLDRLRAPGIGRIEARLLAPYDAVAVQTQADREALRELVGSPAATRSLLLPNGVASDLLSLPVASSETVLFVAELSGEYRPTVLWLLRRIWPAVRRERPHARLLIVGRGADDEVRAAMAAVAGVQHQEGLPSLRPCYAEARVVWSPVFKGYGLINKSLEAMAAGCAVVGGDRAFNGIAGFVPGQHGLAIGMGDEAGWLRETTRLLAAPEAAAQLGAKARALVAEAFSWPRTVQALFAALGLPTHADGTDVRQPK